MHDRYDIGDRVQKGLFDLAGHMKSINHGNDLTVGYRNTVSPISVTDEGNLEFSLANIKRGAGNPSRGIGECSGMGELQGIQVVYGFRYTAMSLVTGMIVVGGQDVDSTCF